MASMSTSLFNRFLSCFYSSWSSLSCSGCTECNSESSWSSAVFTSRHSMPSGAVGFSVYPRKSSTRSALIYDLLTTVITSTVEFPRVVMLPKLNSSSRITTSGMIVLAEKGTFSTRPPRMRMTISPLIVTSSFAKNLTYRSFYSSPRILPFAGTTST
jgi:hypothetical protein